MRIIIFYILFVFFPLFLSQIPKIAIVGAGIGGASLSHYLTELFPHLDVVIFEKNSEVGGRTEHFNVNGEEIEMGASFFITQNLNLVDLARIYNVSSKAEKMDKEILALWDGEEFVWKSSTNKYISIAKMLWRYGLSPYHLKNEVDAWVENFMKAYDFEPFENYTEFLKIIKAESTVKLIDHLAKNNYDHKYINEFVAGVVSGIYNQNYKDINSLAGMISLKGVFDKAHSFNGGNRKLVKSIIEGNPRVKLNLNSEVIFVKKWENSKFSIDFIQDKNTKIQGNFDLVIFATPIQWVEFKNVAINKKNLLLAKDYVDTFVTLVAGNLHCLYFSKTDSECPGVVLSTNYENSVVTDYARVCKSCYEAEGVNLDVYKFQSVRKLSETDLHIFFPFTYKVMKEKEWKAYPKLKTIMKEEQLPDIRLDEGVYAINGMEHLASCMEMETISAKNIARLIAKYEGKKWAKRNKQGDIEEYDDLNNSNEKKDL